MDATGFGLGATRIATKAQTFVSLVPEALHFEVAAIFLFLGALATLAFFAYELGVSPKDRNLLKELFLSLVASALLGFGTLFLLLWTGLAG